MNQSRTIFTRRWRSAAAFLLLLFGAVASGCSRQTQAEGQTLGKAGVATANNLADYYHSLSQDVLDTWEMTTYDQALLGRPADPMLIQNFQSDLKAIAARERMARQLASTYSSLLQIASNDASGTVKIAAEGLTGEVQNVAGKPFHNQGDAAPFVGDLLGGLASVQQSGDIRRASRVLADLVTQLDAMVRKEQFIYTALEKDKGNVLNLILAKLINDKKVLVQPLLASVPQSLGLTWANPDQPLDDQTTKALVAVAQVRTERLTSASVAAGESTSQSLALLLTQHKSLLAHKAVTTADVLASVQKAQMYLDDLNKLQGNGSKTSAK